jgi:hypothetical protein
MQQSHLTGAPSNQVMEASATPIVPGQGAPFASTHRTRPLFTRWIEAKEQATLIQIQDRDCEDMTRPGLMDALGGNQPGATITP